MEFVNVNCDIVIDAEREIVFNFVSFQYFHFLIPLWSAHILAAMWWFIIAIDSGKHTKPSYLNWVNFPVLKAPATQSLCIFIVKATCLITSDSLHVNRTI